YSQYLSQNPNGSVEGFKSWIDNNQSDVQYQQSSNKPNTDLSGSFDLLQSDIVDNKTEELYPYSGLNEIDNENKTTSNKEIFFRGKTSISANEALKNAIDADIFQSDDKVAFF